MIESNINQRLREKAENSPLRASQIEIAPSDDVHEFIIAPEHIDTLFRDNYTKADVRKRIQEVTSKALHELVADNTSGVGLDPSKTAAMSDEKLAHQIPKFASEDNIHIVVAGSDAGKFSGVFHGWASGPMGSMPVSKKIED